MNANGMEQPALDLSAIRAKLESGKGPQFWRSLDEVAATPEFQRFLEDEFPSRADEFKKPATEASRRDLLRLLGASFALAGLTGCTKQPQEKIVPYVKQPDNQILGRPMFYATAMPWRGAGVGLLVESYEGRPTKVEGNPQHPGSLGRTMVQHQAATLGLYDPDRSQSVTVNGRPSSFGRVLEAMADVRTNQAQGEGVRVLSESVASPALLAQKAALQQRYPQLVWHEYEPVNQDEAYEGARLAFGRPVKTLYRFDQADVVVSLDADFMMNNPGAVPYARGFMARRNAQADHKTVNRLYVAEPTPTVTGSNADHRLPVKASLIEPLARALAAEVGVAGAAPVNLPPELVRWAQVAGRDLKARGARTIVIAGEQQPAAVHALANAINGVLGNVGTAVFHVEPPEATPINNRQSLRELVGAMYAGQVRTLLILGGNPVYNAPVELNFAAALRKVPLSLHLGLYRDETGLRTTWHVPEAHFLEQWSDVRAYDGTCSIVQPLIAPLYEGRSAHELLATLTDSPDQSAYQIVRAYWQGQRGAANFDQQWEQWVHDGVIPDSGYTIATVTPQANIGALPVSRPAQGLEVTFRPDPHVFDGRYANNSWLQECPKPLTKLTWDNAAHISPATAERLGLQSNDTVEFTLNGRKVRGPVWVLPGQANEAITVHLGYGRTAGGFNAEGAGFNAYLLRTVNQPHHADGLEVQKTGDKWELACTQTHHSLEGRDIIRHTTSAAYAANPQVVANHEKESNQVTLSLYPEWKFEGHRWGMVIDQTACIGCNSCIVACQAENNIPSVGKGEIKRGREMHWLRIDRYYTGGLDSPRTLFQPMMCVHCEQAPCEPVCPVAATVHSGEGINQMIYNRCVGTRYCSNNCPYKVRRFNFRLYQDWNTPQLEPLRNPQVTVRSRGVMEKCTYCIQRIEQAKIEAEKEERPIRDGEIITACQSSCPTDAIVFGDINDKESKVYKLKRNPLNYSVLSELSTQPRTTYTARLRNPNPELERPS